MRVYNFTTALFNIAKKSEKKSYFNTNNYKISINFLIL